MFCILCLLLQVITDGAENEDLGEVAKLFGLHLSSEELEAAEAAAASSD